MADHQSFLRLEPDLDQAADGFGAGRSVFRAVGLGPINLSPDRSN